jgi:hypothetical protein
VRKQAHEAAQIWRPGQRQGDVTPLAAGEIAVDVSDKRITGIRPTEQR